MADVVLTHSYMLRRDPKQWNDGAPYPPLATIQVAACLRASGRSVALFDTQLQASTADFKAFLEREKPHTVVVYDDGFNYLTKMCLTNMREVAFELLQGGKDVGCTTIVWSSDATDHAELFLANGADVVMIGEAERTLLELLDRIDASKTIDGVDDVDGIALMRNGAVLRTRPREIMRSLDELPLPAWDLVDVDAYRAFRTQHGKPFSLNVVTTRGCPFKCNWCAKPIYGTRYTSYSPQRIADEVTMLHERYAPEHIWFCDDIFGLKPGWVAAFADILEARGIRIPFTIQSRADLLVKDATVANLARAGCERVWIGAESGSQRILDAMDKGITVEEIRAAVAMARTHAISPALFLQFGYPSENMGDIRATINMVRELAPDEIGVSVSYPLPGTAFYESVRHELTEKSNWSDSDELMLMFKNTYDADFYRKLQRHVHTVLRREQGRRAMRSPRWMRRHWKRAALLPYYAANEERAERAFSAQAPVFDALETENAIVQWMRARTYRVAEHYFAPGDAVLELNAGTGIDAAHFASQGIRITPTDAATGMVEQMREKLSPLGIEPIHCAYTNLATLGERRFDHAFSNFGGLNCTDQLDVVLHDLAALLPSNGIVVMSVMPPYSLWEFASLLRGHGRRAFRRLRRGGAPSHVEGVVFTSTYYSVAAIKRMAQPFFTLEHAEPLGLITPPPHHGAWSRRMPRLASWCMRTDDVLRAFRPAASFADHAIVVLRRTRIR